MERIRKLDYYVAGTFLGPFLLCLATFAGLYVVIDFFSNIDKFLSQETVRAAIWRSIVFYVYSTPAYLATVLPVLVVVSATVCVIRLERSNEVCAMKSSGISARRIALPAIGCSAVIAVLAYVNQEWVVPALHEPLLMAEHNLRDTEDRPEGFCYMVDHYGQHMLISSFDMETPLPTLTNVRITWEGKFGVPHEEESARAFAPNPDKLDTWYMGRSRRFSGRYTLFRQKEWEEGIPPHSLVSPVVEKMLKDYRAQGERANVPLIASETEPETRLYEFGSYTETTEYWPVARNIEIIYPSDPGKGRRVIAMMVWVDDRWLVFGASKIGLGIDPKTGRVPSERIADGEVFETTLRPTDIRKGGFKETNSTLTLSELADAGARFQSTSFLRRCWVAIWHRLVYPLANVFLVLLTLPVVFRHHNRSALMGVSLALTLTVLYMLSDSVSAEIANWEWSLWRWPFFAGTFPSILFGAIGAWMFTRSDEV